MMRAMELKVEDWVLYSSSFDTSTGTLVRAVEPFEITEQVDYGSFSTQGTRDNIPYNIQDKLQKRFPHRFRRVASPVPETVDVSITNRCGFGCTYCYQDSTSQAEHGNKELVPALIKGFEQPPYQIAIGGGEPTQHPDFIWILEQARQLGTVPNYTTAGHAMTNKIIRATNELCGGVAITYHQFKGFDWFRQRYLNLHKKLTCQLNIHLIADKNVAKGIDDLIKLQQEVGSVNLVLLAYYPDVGRASMDLVMTRRIYTTYMAEAIVAARSAGIQIAFSEGLLPYFLSRPELGVNTTFATGMEGFFSCYVGPDGRMSTSSFDPADDGPTVFEQPSQKIWNEMRVWGSASPSGEPCYSCRLADQCSTPHSFHYLTCAFAGHNKLPLAEIKGPSRFKVLGED